MSTELLMLLAVALFVLLPLLAGVLIYQAERSYDEDEYL
jgi:hypothetical protein